MKLKKTDTDVLHRYVIVISLENSMTIFPYYLKRSRSKNFIYRKFGLLVIFYARLGLM